jgi:Cu-Zn family superoxide dismutase
MSKVASILASLLFLMGISLAARQAAGSPQPKSVTITIKNNDGKSVGTATFTEMNPGAPGVKLQLDITNMQPGAHGFHIHKNAACEPPDFQSAGGQFMPDAGMPGHDHDHELPPGNPNETPVTVGADGTGHLSYEFPKLTMGDDSHSLFANGGTAIIFHTVRGTAGPNRVACGEIKKPQ